MRTREGLGPFELEEPIGEGGMGFVFRARHSRTGMPAAIKVIRGTIREDQVEHFHREVEAHAGLVHPGIVTLFEYGRVDAEAVDASGGNISEGSPFVAMEFSERGTIGDHLPFTGWRLVRKVLVQILDALAYAHARGVIHRDLKPENFLVFGDDQSGASSSPADESRSSEFARVKLADFGIAHAFSRERMRDTGDLRAVSGTPFYMPPEQLRGEWRSYGPWTDLYATGCIAWELICGEPPFDADNAMALALKHETENRPSLDPMFPVPDELERWVHRAMASDPRDRFQRAADAAAALPEADKPVHGDRGGSNESNEHSHREAPTVEQTASGPQFEAVAPTLQLSETAEPDGVDESVLTEPETPDDGDDEPSRNERPGGLSDDSMRLPASWRTERTNDVSAPMVDTGLGLFGLREIPFVDRERERDLLWNRLREVADSDGFHLTLVAGDAGSGKSRLAEWMVRRAHEVGQTENFRVRHAPDGNGAGDGLAGMVARKFHTWSLERDGVENLLDDALPSHPDDSFQESDVRALTEFLRPTDQEDLQAEKSTYRFSDDGQRYALLERLLERYARDRVPAIWIDDVQWGLDTLGWLDHLSRSADPPRAWVVATVRRDLLADQPLVSSKMDDLVDNRAGCERVDVEPLSYDDHRALIQRLLPLAPRVVDLVASRTEGNPLFAVQLVEDWVERGRLIIGDDGFELDDSQSVELPGGIHDLWMQRLGRAVVALGDDAAWLYMELAATLGRELDATEWEALVPADSEAFAGQMVSLLVDRGLAVRTSDGWAWTHGMLVSSLRRRANEQGRLASYHRRCAEMLEQVDRPARQTAARRANHWIEAGELERALSPLLVEAEHHAERSAYDQAGVVLDRRRELLDALEVSYAEIPWLEQYLEEASTAYGAGNFSTVRKRIETIRERASGRRGAILRADAERLAGNCEVMESSLETARERYQEALSLLDDLEGPEVAEARGRVFGGWASLELDAGRIDRANELAQRGVEAAQQAERPYDRLAARRIQAWAAVDGGDASRARRIFQSIYDEAQGFGFRNLQADCVNGLGGIAARHDDVDEAVRWYERYAQMGRELGKDTHVVIAHLNTAEVLVEDGAFSDAATYLNRAESLIEAGASIRRDDFIRVLRMACAAGQGRREAFDALWAHYSNGWPEQARCHSGHGNALDVAAELAAGTFGVDRARAVWELAASLWQQLGRDDKVDRIRQKLADL